MLLKSSSTPVLGSLISSISESHNNSNHHHHNSLNKSPYHHQIGFLSFTTISCNSSPISPTIAEFSEYRSRKGLRRAQSEGHLEGLAFTCNSSYDNCHNSSQTKKISGRQKCLMLETIPSFSLCNFRGRVKEEDDDDDDWSEIAGEEDRIQVEANAGLGSKMENMVLGEQVGVTDRSWNMGFQMGEETHLAKGFGIDGGNDGNGRGGIGGIRGGNNGGFHWGDGDGGSGDMHGAEEYYKKVVQENPDNPLFLRNYAEFLYQTKGDLEGAEEYYSRAILADQKDGEILSQYAKLVWELHRDQDKASSYFERAVQASPEDSHIHAAYASFLWETEEDEDECNEPNDMTGMPPHFHQGAMASTEF